MTKIMMVIIVGMVVLGLYNLGRKAHRMEQVEEDIFRKYLK